MVSEVLKRLEEIEGAPALGHPQSLRGMQDDIEWLCARLRDALEVLESRKETIEQALWLFELRGKSPKWVDAYRRLFRGEVKSGL